MAKTIYLAGGFKSGWQKTVKSNLSGYDFLDPSAHNIQDPKEYTEWDLAAVGRCDIVLANMEQSNPGGYSLALEVGFAKALGKTIILVDQIENPTVSKYFEMVRQVSDATFGDLDSALEHLNAKTRG
ncbi:MAG: nucleoside 2-deoxyribosyltransferase domain-containing protein [Sulfuricella sp.]